MFNSPFYSQLLDRYVSGSAFQAAITPPATPSDVFTIYGRAGVLWVGVTRAWLSTRQTTAGNNAWFLVKRSTAQTGGTSVQITSVSHDVLDAPTPLYPALASVFYWTANFTGGGTLVGTVWGGLVNSPAPATAGPGGFQGVMVDFIQLYGKPIVLRNSIESLNWNFNGAALPPGLAVYAGFDWVEYQVPGQ